MDEERIIHKLSSVIDLLNHYTARSMGKPSIRVRYDYDGINKREEFTILNHDTLNSGIRTDSLNGNYHRMLAEGTYTIVFSSPNHFPDTISGVTVNNFQTTWLNVELVPEDPVPVELVSFTAEVFKNDVVLKWQTATEINNAGFEVERCRSISNFEFRISNFDPLSAQFLADRLRKTLGGEVAQGQCRPFRCEPLGGRTTDSRCGAGDPVHAVVAGGDLHEALELREVRVSRDHADGTGIGVFAVERTLRATQYFDALDIEKREALQDDVFHHHFIHDDGHRLRGREVKVCVAKTAQVETRCDTTIG
mgnify:CR=1 FL=1